MRNRTLLPLIVALLAVPAAAPAHARPVSVTGEHDLGALLQRAEKSFDLEAEDAVYLLDSAREDWTSDGRRIRTLHRAVLIRTAQSVRSLADLRVPFDASRQRLTVTTLRTWRLSDERWTDAGPTARVETLPFALDHAPDYAHRREMMILHDGVELPCILETVYTIEDAEPYRTGVVDRRSLARDHPAVVSRFMLGYPAGAAPGYVATEGVPEPVRRRDAASGRDTLTFEMGPVEPIAYPQTPESLLQEPQVLWSTFKDWADLARDVDGRFNNAATLGDAVRDRLAEHLANAQTDAEKARLIAGFIKDTTRYIDYPSNWRPAPRSADRTWKTAYGNRVDRAVLAAALYREAGFDAMLFFRGSAYADAEVRVPNLSWTDGPGVWIGGETVMGCFDPVNARFSAGPSSLFHRAIWRPGLDAAPTASWDNVEAPSRVAVRLDLAYDADGERWTGSGTLNATGVLSPYPRMAGFGNEAQAQLESMAGALVGAAEITGYNPAIFGPAEVTVGFTLEMPAGKRDALDRLHVKLADPHVLSALLAHAAIQLHEEGRATAVVFPTAVEQQLELRLDAADLDVVHVPAERRVANDAGSCIVTASVDDGEIVLTRSLSLDRRAYAPGEWPALRRLLLADAHEAGRLVLLK
jgi:hypothetical protein